MFRSVLGSLGHASLGLVLLAPGPQLRINPIPTGYDIGYVIAGSVLDEPKGFAAARLQADGDAWLATWNSYHSEGGEPFAIEETRFTTAWVPLRTVQQQYVEPNYDIDAVITGSHVRGRVRWNRDPARDRDLDHGLEGSPLLGGMLIPLLTSADLSSEWQRTFTVYSPSPDRIDTVTVRVDGIESVVVPAGTFSAFRVSYQSGRRRSVMHFRTEKPHLLVRSESVGSALIVMANRIAPNGKASPPMRPIPVTP